MQTPKKNSAMACVIAFVSMSLVAGCSTRVIFVPEGTPVRLAEPVRARVFVKDDKGQVVRSANKMTIPAGWYALPKD